LRGGTGRGWGVSPDALEDGGFVDGASVVVAGDGPRVDLGLHPGELRGAGPGGRIWEKLNRLDDAAIGALVAAVADDRRGVLDTRLENLRKRTEKADARWLRTWRSTSTAPTSSTASPSRDSRRSACRPITHRGEAPVPRGACSG
jgi:hypothetical protein